MSNLCQRCTRIRNFDESACVCERPPLLTKEAEDLRHRADTAEAALEVVRDQLKDTVAALDRLVARLEAAEAKAATFGATSQGVLDMAIRAEREACAKVAENESQVFTNVDLSDPFDLRKTREFDTAANLRAAGIAIRIRRRGGR